MCVCVCVFIIWEHHCSIFKQFCLYPAHTLSPDSYYWSALSLSHGMVCPVTNMVTTMTLVVRYKCILMLDYEHRYVEWIWQNISAWYLLNHLLCVRTKVEFYILVFVVFLFLVCLQPLPFISSIQLHSHFNIRITKPIVIAVAVAVDVLIIVNVGVFNKPVFCFSFLFCFCCIC